jgi:hypothetical protein
MICQCLVDDFAELLLSYYILYIDMNEHFCWRVYDYTSIMILYKYEFTSFIHAGTLSDEKYNLLSEINIFRKNLVTV